MAASRVSCLLIALFLIGGVSHALAQEVDHNTEPLIEADTVDAGEGIADPTEGQEAAGAHVEEGDHGDGHVKVIPPVWLVAPFIILLLMIATGPLFYVHHWHKHYPKYAVGLGMFVTLYYLIVLHDGISMLHALQEYLSFIALVA
ncbi:MAG: citrate transporter, partial [Rhodothermaceae bacterium]|nr:citrate transporter [Rhodothermaceae bacterium]